MATVPLVTVLMPVYNAEKYLSEAIESILNQTLRDFEFIIINDGSTDETAAILARYQQVDGRIHIHQQENKGLIASLNRGCQLASGKYIARMDADDVSLPDRLARQVEYLEAHPEIGIVGSPCWLINECGHQYGIYSVPTSDLEIRWRSLLGSPFTHPVVMMRHEILVWYSLTYDDGWLAVEDYDLWTRMLRYTQGVNLIKPLLKYRVHFGETHRHREIQLKNHDRIAFRTIQEQLPEFDIDIEQVSQMRALFVGGSEEAPGLNTRRVALAELYLDMFKAFMNCHPGEPDLKVLQRQEALTVARLILHPPIQAGWMRLIGRLITVDPGLPWYYLGYLSCAICRQLRRRTLDMLRHKQRIQSNAGSPKQ